MARTNMAGQPGAALRGLRADFARALDRRVEGVLERAAVALPVAAGFPLVVLPLPFLLFDVPGWMLWCMPVLGACLCGYAALAWLRRPAAADDGARTPDEILDDLAAGGDSEETVGMAVEWALTRSDCAVAHGVVDIPDTKPDIDHLVATPAGIWVVETKPRWIKSEDFPEVLRRIAGNVDAVRRWPPARGVPVRGALVFAALEPERREMVDEPYDWHGERIRAFKDREELARELRRSTGTVADRVPGNLLREVWNRRSAGDGRRDRRPA